MAQGTGIQVEQILPLLVANLPGHILDQVFLSARVCDEEGIPFSLADREVRTTLLRAWRSMTMWQRAKMMSGLMAGIFAGESGGDYNALFGYRNRQPGAPQVSNMTVGQVIDYTSARGPGSYGQSVKNEIGRIATPVGAYQVVGTTLREAVNALGIDPNAKFDQATQDRIGQWILEKQGTGAWEGYRGPRDPGSVRMSSKGRSSGYSGGSL